ncbi:MAG: alpha/beta fold hydrolase [Dehalococcoidia bacterium]
MHGNYSDFIDSGGPRLACRVWPGPDSAMPVVLLHGLAQSSAAWQVVATRLSRSRTVFAWDARGHGGSDWATDAAYAGDAHFADVARALDALGIERCILVGFSMGGGVAILCGGALPDRVARLVVVDAYPDPIMSPGSRQIAEFIAAYRSAERRPPFDPAIARSMAEQLSGDDPRRLDLWPFWEAGEQPALLVRGARSTVLTEAMAAEMVRRRPSSRLTTIPHVAHPILAQRPAELAAAIESFTANDQPFATEENLDV